MSRRLWIGLFALTALAAVAAALRFGTGAHGSSRASLFGLTARGHAVRLAHDSAVGLRAASARLLAVRAGRAFYRLETADGACFATGPAGSIGDVGGEFCPRAGTFPSAAEPLLDLSVYESTSRASRQVGAVRVEGFAADGVAAVGFLTSGGRIGLRTPVVANTFATTAQPPSPVEGVVALDADGQRISVATR